MDVFLSGVKLGFKLWIFGLFFTEACPSEPAYALATSLRQ